MAFKDVSRILQRIFPANETSMTAQTLHNPIPRLGCIEEAQITIPLRLTFCVESYQELFNKTQNINLFIQTYFATFEVGPIEFNTSIPKQDPILPTFLVGRLGYNL